MKQNDLGVPVSQKIEIEKPEQPVCVQVDPKPKGVAVMEINGDPNSLEIMIIPEYEASLWYLSLTGGGTSEKHWTNQWMDIPSSETRKKMDNVYLVDLDTDGGFDIATTEENGGWGIIWFENPSCNLAK